MKAINFPIDYFLSPLTSFCFARLVSCLFQDPYFHSLFWLLVARTSISYFSNSIPSNVFWSFELLKTCFSITLSFSPHLILSSSALHFPIYTCWRAGKGLHSTKRPVLPQHAPFSGTVFHLCLQNFDLYLFFFFLCLKWVQCSIILKGVWLNFGVLLKFLILFEILCSEFCLLYYNV